MKQKFDMNHSISMQIKHQKQRIKETIDTNKSAFLQERQKAYYSHKDGINKSKTMRSSQYGQFLTHTQTSYFEKIGQHKQVGQEYDNMMKELEKQEQ